MRKPLTALLCLAAVAITILPVALAQGAGSAPTVTTSAATSVTGTGATLNGSVNPNGQQTSYAFQWGPTTGYGHETTLTSAGSGTGTSSVSATLSSLASGTTYHFRIIAISGGGTSVGADQSFTTTGTPPAPSPAPNATTGTSSNVGFSGATVTGTVNPSGQATTYYFEYGPTSNYGFETSPTDAGSSVTSQAVSASLSGLASGTSYHYRLVAVSNGGTALGDDESFTTRTAGTPSHVAFMGRMGFVSPGGIIGVEAGCFGGLVTCRGHVTMGHNGIVIGQRNFSIPPNSGGFQNIGLNAQGKQMLRANSVFHLLAVNVSVTTTTGQRTAQVMHLARWVWN
jgi:Fibronectin type III domain